MKWGLAAKAVGIAFGGFTVMCAVVLGLGYGMWQAMTRLDRFHEGLGLVLPLALPIVCALSWAAALVYQALKMEG